MKTDTLQTSRGFTIIEIIVTVVVLSILLTITWASVTSYQAFARDRERDSDTQSITRSLERYYRSEASSGVSPSYPTATQINTESYRTQIIPTTDQRLYAPNSGSVSLSATTSTSQPSPTTSQYIYQPFTESGTICSVSGDTPCVRFLLFYRSEQSNGVMTIESSHQQ